MSKPPPLHVQRTVHRNLYMRVKSAERVPGKARTWKVTLPCGHWKIAISGARPRKAKCEEENCNYWLGGAER